MELGRKIIEVEEKINKQGGHELKAQAEKCKILTSVRFAFRINNLDFG